MGGGGGAGGCPTTGPAYVHGDLWAFWHNGRVACDAQRRWLWVCEKRLGAGNCPQEKSWFDNCWAATGAFPKTSWVDSQGKNYPQPHSANYGQCQPPHWTEKNNASSRPNNPIPCDTTKNNYEALRLTDPFYGNDWWDTGPSMRHLTVKVYPAAVDPKTSEGKADGLVNLSTHPGAEDAFMGGLSNHSYAGHQKAGGCVAPFTNNKEAAYPSNNFGSFFWLEVPTDRAVTLAATWTGRLAGNLGLQCITGLYFFPSSFGYHAQPGKPWFIESPCYDTVRNVTLEPGAHYVWDVRGFRKLAGCQVPQELLDTVPSAQRAPFAAGSCSSM